MLAETFRAVYNREGLSVSFDFLLDIWTICGLDQLKVEVGVISIGPSAQHSISILCSQFREDIVRQSTSKAGRERNSAHLLLRVTQTNAHPLTGVAQPWISGLVDASVGGKLVI